VCPPLWGNLSPSASNFALKQTAQDHHEEFDDLTIQSIEKGLYIDDLCKSVVNTEVAIKLADQLCSVASC
jgi:hypothetical protein